MKNNIISALEFIAISALIIAPLSLLALDTNLLFPYITSKAFVFRVIVEILVASWISLALLVPRYRISWHHPLVGAFTLFMGIMLVANLTGLDWYQSFWSNAERMDGYIGLLHLYGFFIAGLAIICASKKEAPLWQNLVWIFAFIIGLGATYTTTFASIVGTYSALVLLLTFVAMGFIFAPSFRKPNIPKSLLHSLLALGIYLGVIAIFQDSNRADSILGNPIYLATYSSFALTICLYYASMIQSHSRQNLIAFASYLLGAGFFLLIIFETASRGAILGLVFGGLTAALTASFTVRDKEKRAWRWAGIILAVFIISSMGLFFGFKDKIAESDYLPSSHLIKRVAHFSLQDTTTKHRVANWEQAIEGFKERPLLGWGQEHYMEVFSKYYQADKLYDAEQWFDRTHNMFLDWLIFGGILGLGSFLLVLGVAIWIIWARTGSSIDNLNRSILTGIIVMYMAQNFVAFDALATSIWFTSILILIGYLYQAKRQNSSTHPAIIRDSIALLAVVTVWLGMIYWMYISVYETRAYAHQYMQVMRPISSGINLGTLRELQYPSVAEAVEANTLFKQEFLEQFINSPKIFLHPDISKETREKYGALVVKEAEAQIAREPHASRLPLFYANFLIQTGNPDRALPYLEQVHRNSPEKIQPLWLLGQVYESKGDTEQALEYFQMASELAPEYEEAQERYQKAQERMSDQ
ncbi:MAG: O-antigen ligase family protein [Patescibacteria group bacterium]